MCVIIGTYSLVTAVIICLGYNVFYFDLKLPNGSVGQLLDLADYISNSFLMPFISLLTSILIGWVIGPKWITDEVIKNGESFKREKLYGILMRYVVENSVGIITAICPYVGYQKAAEIAKEAIKTGESVRKLIIEKGLLTKEQMDEIMDPVQMTEPGISGKTVNKI